MKYGISILLSLAAGALCLHCGDEEPCSGWRCVDAGPVRRLDAGVWADPSTICAEAVDPVVSNEAGHVSLGIYSYVPLTARGVIEIPRPLLEKMIGKPIVEFRDPLTEEIMPAEVLNIFTQDVGYSFYVELYDTSGDIDYGAMKIEVIFEITCNSVDASASSTTTIQSSTFVDWCYWDKYQNEAVSLFGWASSGDNCIKCDYETCEW